jgi:hypothetical protein
MTTESSDGDYDLDPDTEEEQTCEHEREHREGAPVSGYLVHLIRCRENPIEAEVFRRVCMRHGLQSWDVMHQYLPWRSRNDLRATLCKTLHKQAIAEYQDIHADPKRIREDNAQLIATVDDSDYKVKGGMLVNQRWNRYSEDIAHAREENIERYDIDDSEALGVAVPIVMSIEYMQRLARNRAIWLRLLRAVLLAEKAKRRALEPRDLGLEKGLVLRSGDVVTPIPRTPLRYGLDTDKYVFDIRETDSA